MAFHFPPSLSPLSLYVFFIVETFDRREGQPSGMHYIRANRGREREQTFDPLFPQQKFMMWKTGPNNHNNARAPARRGTDRPDTAEVVVVVVVVVIYKSPARFPFGMGRESIREGTAEGRARACERRSKTFRMCISLLRERRCGTDSKE